MYTQAKSIYNLLITYSADLLNELYHAVSGNVSALYPWKKKCHLGFIIKHCIRVEWSAHTRSIGQSHPHIEGYIVLNIY